MQQRDGVEHAHGVARRDIDMLADTGADGDEYRVEFAGRFFRQNVLDFVIDHDLDAHGLDAPDLAHKILARQAIGRNAEMHHAARQRPRLVDLDRVAEPREMICGR